MNNPTLRAKLYEAIAAIDAEAAARRSRKARAERGVWGNPQPDGMGKLELITGQEQVAAILTGLDEAAAAAKAAGDPRRMDQIRCDHAVHLLTDGGFGADAYPPTLDDDDHEHPDDERRDPTTNTPTTNTPTATTPDPAAEPAATSFRAGWA